MAGEKGPERQHDDDVRVTVHTVWAAVVAVAMICGTALAITYMIVS